MILLNDVTSILYLKSLFMNLKKLCFHSKQVIAALQFATSCYSNNSRCAIVASKQF